VQFDFTVFDDDDLRTVNGFNDLYLKYSGFDPVSLYVGNFKNTVSLEQMTSSKYFTFMQRALPNAFALGRKLGIGVKSYGDKWTAAAGVYGGTLEQPSNDGHGVSGRATFSPIHETGRVIHMGISGFWRSSDDDDSVRFRVRPESHVTDTRLVDTRSIDTEDYYSVGVEAALIKGPFAFQGEYMRVDVSRKIDSNPDVDFDGYYVEGSWFLTGESRNYYFKEGMFNSVKPLTSVGQGGMGAWKLAARFSNIDLSDKDINGGKEDNFTIGLNWYPTNQTRIIAEYINVLDVDGGKNDGVEPDVFQMRAQIYW
jgi:phosphate-selective porin OprO/OprP